jgi:hypothetical protein
MFVLKVFAAEVRCTTSAFGDEPRRMLKIINVSANTAVAIFRLKMEAAVLKCWIIFNIRRGSFPKAEVAHQLR